MQWTQTILYILATPILGAFSWLMRCLMQRIETLENKSTMQLTQDQIRQLLNDKMEPLKEEVQRCRTSLDKIVDLLLQK